MVDEILPGDEVPQEDPSFLGETFAAAANAAQNVVGKITMMPVMSSDIAAWGYDPVGFKLQIQFTNNYIYLYENVSPLEFETMMLAPSKGKAFWAFIRRNPVAHPFTRIQ